MNYYLLTLEVNGLIVSQKKIRKELFNHQISEWQNIYALHNKCYEVYHIAESKMNYPVVSRKTKRQQLTNI